MQKPKKVGICAYCGKYKPLTRDHIPPQCFFGKPLPNDLITVPCCVDCWKGQSMDDEYFRATVISSANLWQAPGTAKVYDSFMRSLKKPNKRGFAQMYLGGLTQVEIRTKSGIYLGSEPALKLDEVRFYRVADRIASGLFFHEKKYPVPEGYLIMNMPFQFNLSDFLIKNFDGIAFSPMRLVGNGLFAYSFTCTVEDENSGIIISFFYKKLPFIGFIRAPRNQRQMATNTI